MSAPSFEDVRAAAERIALAVPPTPVLRSAAIDQWVRTRVHLKAEHLHPTGAFKLRGATNAVLLLTDDEAEHGVAAHSSGNHASSLAAAAAKREAVEASGARIVECEATMEARAETLAKVIADSGAVEIHPFDDPRVQAGQGTATLELLAAVPEIGMVVAPVSGGGLLCGTAIAAHGVDRSLPVWGAEPEQVDDAYRSLMAGHLVPGDPRDTIADGLVAQLSEQNLATLQAERVQVVTVTDDEIVEAMRRLATDVKQVVEPSGAVALAGLARLAREGIPLPSDVGVIVSGGNVDLDRWHELVGSA